MDSKRGGSMPEIRKKVVLNAPIVKVWEKVSTSEGIETWWMPNTMKPEVGNMFVLHAPGYGDSYCIITEVEPPCRLGFDWDRDWHLTIELMDLGDNNTEFTLTHSGWFENRKTRFGQNHAEIRRMMDIGWERIVKETLPSRIESR